MSGIIRYGDFTFSATSGFPVPSISISKDFQRDAAGKIFGASLNINLEGQIYSSSGDRGFLHLTSRESGLRSVFSRDGQFFSLACVNQPPTLSGNAKVVRYNAEKTDNRWINTIDYSIDLQIESYEKQSGIFLVSSVQDSYNLEPLDDIAYSNLDYGMSAIGMRNLCLGSRSKEYPSYRVTRTLSAVGKFVPSGNATSGMSAVENAKEWVRNQIQNGTSFTGIITGLKLYNFVRSINMSETEGAFGITDTWIAVSATGIPYTESFTIESSLDAALERTVVVNGTVQGLENFPTGEIYTYPYITGGVSGTLTDVMSGARLLNKGSKFDNAISGYSGIKNCMYQRASAFVPIWSTNPTAPAPGDCSCSGFNFVSTFNRQENTLNPIPISITEGFRPSEGVITYSWSYNNRPRPTISGIISENLTIDDNFGTPQFASIFVLGRRLGPVLQNLGTLGPSSRTVTYEVVMPKPSSLRNLVFPVSVYNSVTGLVDTLNPQTLFGNIAVVERTNTENWVPTEGRFVKIRSWEWIRCST